MKKHQLICLVLSLFLLAGCGSKPKNVDVTGRVVDIYGSPAVGATIQIAKKATTIPPFSSSGAFLLEDVPSGKHTMTITKPGFEAVERQVSLKSGTQDLGIIEITQSQPPSYGGAYNDNRLITPTIVNGIGEFDIPTPYSNGEAWIMLFPQTETAGSYPVTITSTPGTQATMTTQSLSKESSRSGRVRKAGLSASNGVHAWLRNSERELLKYRSQALASKQGMRATAIDKVGTVRNFKKTDFSTGTEKTVTVTATCQAVGSHVAIYVDNAAPQSSTFINALLSAFDSFQPDLVDTFGAEFDVDSNNRIIILLTPLPVPLGTLYGYFWGGNEFPKSVIQDSNETDMIYINPLSDQVETIKGVLAHEYQHYLHFSNRLMYGGALDDVWINEGFAMLAADLTGHGYLAGDAVAVLQVKDWAADTRSWSLVHWNDDNESYGGAYVFARYLFDHYGRNVTLGINRHAYGGTKAITDMVGGEFGDVFRSFAASLALSYYGSTSPDKRLGFPSGFRLPSDVVGYGFSAGAGQYANTSVAPWGLVFAWLEGGGTDTRQHISIEATLSGKYGAVVVTGF